jgi:hypothetical protein
LKQARWEAILANLDHGVPLSAKVKKYAFKSYVVSGAYRNEDGSLKSYKEISKDLGGLLSKTSAFRYMAELYPGIAKDISEEHGIISNQEEDPAAVGGLRDLPPVLSVREDLIQGVRDAVATALDEAAGDEDFREALAATLRDILAELKNVKASALGGAASSRGAVIGAKSKVVESVNG